MASEHRTPNNPRFIDLTGRTFVRWTVLYYAGRGTNSLWFCQCKCGRTNVVSGPHLTRGKSTGCRECSGVGVVTHGMSDSPEFTSWRGMIERCTNSNHRQYADYGGRGIRVCDRWANSFQAFFDDMGQRPEGKTLDRYPDHNGNYEPGNCRWATQTEQMRHTRRSRYLTFRNETKLLIEWAEAGGISEKTIRTRLRDGWTIERALTTPARNHAPSPSAS